MTNNNLVLKKHKKNKSKNKQKQKKPTTTQKNRKKYPLLEIQITANIFKRYMYQDRINGIQAGNYLNNMCTFFECKLTYI